MMMLNPSTYLNQGYRANGDDLVNTTTIHGITYNVDDDGYVVYTKTLNSVETTQKVMKMTYNSNTSEWAGGYYNRDVGCLPSSVVFGSEYECSEVDYSSIGLKDSAKDYIQEIDWKIGGYNTTEVTTNNMYIAERGSRVVNNTRPTTWKGKVALMYATDWALAAALSTETSEGNGTYCKDTNLSLWNNYSPCYNNWLYTGSYTWTLTPNSSNSYYACRFNSSLSYYYYVSNAYTVRPVLYLKASSLVIGGDGSSENPYQLML